MPHHETHEQHADRTECYSLNLQNQTAKADQHGVNQGQGHDVYDVVASGVTKVKAKLSKRVYSSSLPVQLTLFDVVQEILVSGFKRLQALFFPWSETVLDAKGHPKPEFKDDYYSRYSALNDAYFELDEFRSAVV